MTTAFQQSAFQDDAFQIDGAVVVAPVVAPDTVGSGRYPYGTKGELERIRESEAKRVNEIIKALEKHVPELSQLGPGAVRMVALRLRRERFEAINNKDRLITKTIEVIQQLYWEGMEFFERMPEPYTPAPMEFERVDPKEVAWNKLMGLGRPYEYH